jgi:hypothetical protein
MLRERGWLAVREEDGGELLDPVASRAFAVADHQVAHVYVPDAGIVNEVRTALEAVPGVARVLAGKERAEIGLDHPRAGDLVVLAEPAAWFTYYYWSEDARAPDFARTVEIHRKPGYDPVELFLNPQIRHPKLAIGTRLVRRRLGFRALMDVIPLDAELVRGSHGVAPRTEAEGPLIMLSHPAEIGDQAIDAIDVRKVIMSQMFGG